jgi:SAM-dependent methyltransferase
MRKQALHDMLPRATHDEAARQEFVVALRKEVVFEARVGARTVYDERVKPAFQKRHGRWPKDRHEVRKAMLADPYAQFASALRRTTQEVMWDSVGESVERQLDGLIRKSKNLKKLRGTLRLDPNIRLPRYLTAVDIHCMPGNYSTELTDDDVFAGALYDRGAYLRALGGIGDYNDDFGRTAASYLQTRYPRFRPNRILDMGCGVGHSTLPFCDVFPRADVHAIDVSAPVLRYGHARAEALGKALHFSQQDAENTDFADGSFGLIVSVATLHETSNKAARHILAECFRLLAPGGLCLHYEGRPWDRMSPFDAAVHDWDTHFNAEPFIGKLHDLDPEKLMTEAGFAKENYIDEYVASALVTGGFKGEVGTAGAKGGAMWFFGATK